MCQLTDTMEEAQDVIWDYLPGIHRMVLRLSSICRVFASMKRRGEIARGVCGFCSRADVVM